ncbi:adenosylcobinamide-GDP ribazoletransferase [Vibrio sp. SCSIO 43136]|uniref:adenosylcobinamide-GDP ribazoletransferase n=1 Tax=Vibrio sp. SCSIO 43136 TaxID=2819101 RepID=UPI00207605F3|nr:adenosylcobinamide-GDP ribazoletransferase [Vibrio sp. SCSIO 43136]USD63986.1 adenosylcobinamide-GDP ribazoletransferase [Vibrio sp. SCSIO 43136]
MKTLKYQWQLFCLALSFFSRLPVPSDTPYSPERMNRSGRFFALVGLLLGTLCALSYWVFAAILPITVAVFLTMVISLLLTGAFHEDGLADMADGIGGGMTLERRLEIMKDSRLGTYGAATLTLALLGKFLLLIELAQVTSLVPILMSGYVVSRAVAATLIRSMDYVTDAANSKAKPLAQSQSASEQAFLYLCGALSLLWLPLELAVGVAAALLVLRSLFKRWLNSRLGGFTGDCLGAGQQLAELAFYLICLAYFGATL